MLDERVRLAAEAGEVRNDEYYQYELNQRLSPLNTVLDPLPPMPTGDLFEELKRTAESGAESLVEKFYAMLDGDVNCEKRAIFSIQKQSLIAPLRNIILTGKGEQTAPRITIVSRDGTTLHARDNQTGGEHQTGGEFKYVLVRMMACHVLNLICHAIFIFTFLRYPLAAFWMLLSVMILSSFYVILSPAYAERYNVRVTPQDWDVRHAKHDRACWFAIVTLASEVVYILMVWFRYFETWLRPAAIGLFTCHIFLVCVLFCVRNRRLRMGMTVFRNPGISREMIERRITVIEELMRIAMTSNWRRHPRRLKWYRSACWDSEEGRFLCNLFGMDLDHKALDGVSTFGYSIRVGERYWHGLRN
jgi:hypothetical protein